MKKEGYEEVGEEGQVMAHSQPNTLEEEEEEEKEEDEENQEEEDGQFQFRDGPSHHPSAPPDEVPINGSDFISFFLFFLKSFHSFLFWVPLWFLQLDI